MWDLVGHVKRSGFPHVLKSYWKVLIESDLISFMVYSNHAAW